MIFQELSRKISLKKEGRIKLIEGRIKLIESCCYHYYMLLLFINNQIANTQRIVVGQTGKQIDRQKDIQAESQRERVSD